MGSNGGLFGFGSFAMNLLLFVSKRPPLFIDFVLFTTNQWGYHSLFYFIFK